MVAGAPELDFYTFDAMFKKYGSQYGVPWRWLKAIAMNESSLGTAKSVVRGMVDPHDPESKSSDGLSYGVMQMTLPTAGDMMPGADMAVLNTPELSIQLAAKYVGKLWDMFDGEKEKIVMAYNEGPGNVKKGKVVPEYLSRFQTHLQEVLEDQPGDELETG